MSPEAELVVRHPEGLTSAEVAEITRVRPRVAACRLSRAYRCGWVDRRLVRPRGREGRALLYYVPRGAARARSIAPRSVGAARAGENSPSMSSRTRAALLALTTSPDAVLPAGTRDRLVRLGLARRMGRKHKTVCLTALGWRAAERETTREDA